jgi:hypothetical protein
VHSAVALAGAVGTSGAMSRFETTPLLTAAEEDASRQVTPNYTPPGR